MSDAAEKVAVRCSPVTGPVNEHRPSNDQLSRDKPPIPAVLAVITAVAHYEETVGRHDHRLSGYAEFVSRSRHIDMTARLNSRHLFGVVVNVVGLTRAFFLKLRGRQGRLIIRSVAVHPMFRQQL